MAVNNYTAFGRVYPFALNFAYALSEEFEYELSNSERYVNINIFTESTRM